MKGFEPDRPGNMNPLFNGFEDLENKGHIRVRTDVAIMERTRALKG